MQDEIALLDFHSDGLSINTAGKTSNDHGRLPRDTIA